MAIVDKLVLGTVQFGLQYGINNQGGKLNSDEIFDLLDFAFAQGIDTLDTADAYGDSIDIIGDYHRQRDHRFRVITKFKLENSDSESFREATISCLEKLGIPQFYSCLYHSYTDLIKYPHILSTLKHLKAEGLIRHIGASIYNNDEFDILLDNETIEVIQLPYNLLDNDSQRGSRIKYAKEQGKIVHVRSVFLQGLFFKKLSDLPETLEPLRSNLQRIKGIAMDNNLNVAELSLNYALSNSSIDGVLIGVDNLEQLKSNIRAAQNSISKNIIGTVDSLRVENVSLLNPSNWS